MITPNLSNESKPSTILIVDDMRENLAVLGELLQPTYRVRVASSGERALQVARSYPKPDLILLDVMMPKMDGYEVLTQLRQQSETADIPVIFVTAMDSVNDEEKGLSYGAVDYITKPVRPAIVLARVRAQLELKRNRDLLQNQNHSLETEIARRMGENELILDISMRALAGLAETRDNETGNHIIRTQFYVEILARHMALDERYRTQLTPKAMSLIAKAAPLHDIGKVGIPDNILLKPGKLTEEEWVVMRTHSRLGSDAIASALRDVANHEPLALFHIAMDIAHYHHERWDGTGYPEGLRGEEIPLPARLMAVADVFDALVSRRVYKPPMPLEEACTIIRNGSGSHFDPAIVTAFNACISQFDDVAHRYMDEFPE